MALCGAFALLFATLASAEVARVDITKREDLLNGRSYGAAVAYEWLEGRAHFALDPANPRNDIIVDLKLVIDKRVLVAATHGLGIFYLTLPAS